MYTLLVSIIALALTVALLIATTSFLDEPFYKLNRKTVIIKVNQNYIDLGIILDSADGLNKSFSNINEIRDFNKGLPLLSGVDYDFTSTTMNERVFYNSNIKDEECLIYEKYKLKNNNLTMDEITYSQPVSTFAENNRYNISCYKNSIDNQNYVVFIYPASMH